LYGFLSGMSPSPNPNNPVLSIPLYGFKSNRSNGIIVHKSIDFQFHCMDSELYEALYGSRDIELSIPLYGFRARR